MYDSFQRVIDPTPICSLQIEKMDYERMSSCPTYGNFRFNSRFYLPELVADANKAFHFTPDLNITFTDTHRNRLGCAVTGTSALHVHAQRRHHFGMMSLGFALFVFGFVFAGLLFLSYRRKKRLESLSEKKKPRYQYFRTLPNGQVIPIQQGQSPPVGPPPQHMPLPPAGVPYNVPGGAPQEAFQISNPAYNETQLPPRPVI